VLHYYLVVQARNVFEKKKQRKNQIQDMKRIKKVVIQLLKLLMEFLTIIQMNLMEGKLPMVRIIIFTD
jgi:hypothetical protein